MAEKKNILTEEGLAKLEDELQDLKVNRRKEVAAKIKEAREQGDLSENAEYDEAKNEQGKLYSRIAELEEIIKHAVVVTGDSYAADEVSVNILCHKRNHRCSRLTKRYKCGIKSHVRVNLILSHFLNPETCSRTSYIPVRKLVNKVIKHSCRFCNLVICKVIVNCLNKCIKL